MSEPASISASIASRYATAVFDLARDGGSLAALEADVAALEETLKDSAEFRDLISSPVYGRDEQGRAIAAIAGRMGLSQILANTLALMAGKRRLFVLPQLLSALQDRIAAEKGEATAEVRSAVALTEAQSGRLAEALSKTAGKTVKLNTTVDESLIGGLVVKLGSKMIDTSVASKLASLQNAMKEVG
ncbi:F0F1 ATP synthase subunit delta [Frigidibacter oleivorans]|uniref:F0F1 ATP synthase subunit delta n=1 Tax=Frigidibacter oleivorans TaxID=2487129 RepID=UPI000F8C7A33|nr:F0F1 ATP synthase subunit delta [Frigidibacter oleivorans]